MVTMTLGGSHIVIILVAIYKYISLYPHETHIAKEITINNKSSKSSHIILYKCVMASIAMLNHQRIYSYKPH